MIWQNISLCYVISVDIPAASESVAYIDDSLTYYCANEMCMCVQWWWCNLLHSCTNRSEGVLVFNDLSVYNALGECELSKEISNYKSSMVGKVI